MIQPILDRKVANVTLVLEQHLLRNGQHTDVAVSQVRPPRRRCHRAEYQSETASRVLRRMPPPKISSSSSSLRDGWRRKSSSSLRDASPSKNSAHTWQRQKLWSKNLILWSPFAMALLTLTKTSRIGIL